MTAFGKLIRTTAFRLTLVYLLLFALFAASLLGYFAWNTRRLITEQITTTVNAEIGEVSDIYTRRGLRGLVFTIENRALRPGANLYLVTTPTGQARRRQCRLAGAGRDGDHRAGRRPPTGGSTSRTAATIARWYASPNSPAASGS